MRALTKLDFWNKIEKSSEEDCWEWKYQRDSKGYGRLNSKLVPTHIASRAAYILTYGHIPDEILVCHSCDNPPCCNPQHLFLGTEKDNFNDAVSKGRRKEPTHNYKQLYQQKWYNKNKDKRREYMRLYRAQRSLING